MISGIRPRLRTPERRRLGALLVAAAAAALLPLSAPSQPTSTAAPFTLDALLALLARHDSLRATFHERKFVKQLDGPVDSSGELSFEAPATMVMRTREPRLETLRLDGRNVTVERGRQRRTFGLDEHPEIAIYIEAIRAALAGDKATLERYYAIELEGGAARWKLSLAPKDPRMAGPVETILLSGREGEVRQVEVRLADGDYSVMNIEPASAAR